MNEEEYKWRNERSLLRLKQQIERGNLRAKKQNKQKKKQPKPPKITFWQWAWAVPREQSFMGFPRKNPWPSRFGPVKPEKVIRQRVRPGIHFLRCTLQEDVNCIKRVKIKRLCQNTKKN